MLHCLQGYSMAKGAPQAPPFFVIILIPSPTEDSVNGI
jgi:hypothetical protein